MDYKHIELTDEEICEALLTAKINKEARLRKENEILIAQKKYQELVAPKDYTQLKEFVLQKAKELPFHFELDDYNMKAFKLLCLYFSNDPMFNEEKYRAEDGSVIQEYNLNKGIVLYSKKRGTGKTVMMQLFKQNSKNCFEVVETKKISAYYQTDGALIIDRFSKPWEAVKEARYWYQSPVGICFDDFGDEQIKQNYGNKENVMQRVIQQIYDSDPMHINFKYFHCTTNLSGDEIETRYDTRVRSRMREMFNWIRLDGDDRRK